MAKKEKVKKPNPYIEGIVRKNIKGGKA